MISTVNKTWRRACRFWLCLSKAGEDVFFCEFYKTKKGFFFLFYFWRILLLLYLIISAEAFIECCVAVSLCFKYQLSSPISAQTLTAKLICMVTRVNFGWFFKQYCLSEILTYGYPMPIYFFLLPFWFIQIWVPTLKEFKTRQTRRGCSLRPGLNVTFPGYSNKMKSDVCI